MTLANTAAARPARPPLAILALCASAAVALAGCGEQTPPGGLSRGDARYAVEVLDRAPEQGFAPGAFNVRAIHAAQDRKDPRAEAMIRAAVLDYARAQHGLAIAKADWPAAWGDRPAAYDANTELASALKAGKFRAWLDAQAPQDGLYVALQQAYAAVRSQPETPQSAAQARTLRANLERVRWLPRETPATRIDVNIASATLSYVDGGQTRLVMRTASGKPGDETPTLTSKIDNIVLNPPWNVPEGIAEAELRPKGEGYLESHGFVTTDEGRLVQQPGPGSALGLVKFDFDNPYAVYLHDTPSKAAFDRSGRAVSHGCVRLERAVDLASMVLAEQRGWSKDRLQSVIDSRETTTVKLERPISVRLMYLTAVPASGGVTYLPDVYSWDGAVLDRLDKATSGTAL